MARTWFALIWDPTCGYPGEGPPWRQSIRRPSTPVQPWSPVLEPGWISNSRSMLHGDTRVKGPATSLVAGSSDEEVHETLMALANSWNSDRRVAGRMQTSPCSVEQLLGPESETTKTARGGSAFNFHTRPYQYRRPRPISLAVPQKAAAIQEVKRLTEVCGAVESAPLHDNDKALLWSTAESWERSPLRTGPWPREKKVPILSLKERARYDQAQLREERVRRQQGKPYRDFESTVFTVPKSDGGFRLCTDYRGLNEFQRKVPFKMEGVQQVADLIQPGDHGMLVDLKDAYLTMGLHPSQRKYCRFRSPEDGARMQWTTVSFGMSEAPRMCTKLLKPLIGILKQIGIRCLIYIDDLLLLDQDRDRLARGMAIAMELLQLQVGLQLKTSKCCFRPLKVFKCLGLLWNTQTMQVSVPATRIKETQKTAKRLLTAAGASRELEAQPKGPFRPIPTRDLARFCGQVTSMTRGIRGAKRHLLFIQQALGHAVRRTGWNGTTLLNHEGISALQWWVTEQPWQRNGCDIVPEVRPIQGRVQSDAATEGEGTRFHGWGGTLQIGEGPVLSTRGYFTAKEMTLHINALELLGCWYTVRSLLGLLVPENQWHLVHLSCELDSIVAIKYARVGVSRSLNLSKLGAEFYDWREQTNLQMSYAHLRGIYNVTADTLSREAWSSIEWKLNEGLFDDVQRVWRVRVEIDLFASRHNKQVPRYFTWEHDWEAMGVDSLSHLWLWPETIYAYPPPVLILRILQKMIIECVNDFVLVAPVWPHQPWWPLLMDHQIDLPLLLPNESWVTQDPGLRPSWGATYHLAAFHLSGNSQRVKASRQKLWRQYGGQANMDTIKHTIRTLSGSQHISPRSLGALADSVRGVFLQDH